MQLLANRLTHRLESLSCCLFPLLLNSVGDDDKDRPENPMNKIHVPGQPGEMRLITDTPMMITTA